MACAVRFFLFLCLLVWSLGAAAQPVGPCFQGTSCQINNAPQMINALALGVKADGVTSDDAALNRAALACTATGATLWLPPGRILLTGVQTITLKDCGIIGSGFAGIKSGVTASFGTTILLTSTTVKPFIVGANWSVDGVNFYWPNQSTGTTVYPPLFSDDGVNAPNEWSVRNVGIVNAYDGFAATSGISWNAFKVSNSWMWAVHDLFRLNATGDSFTLSGLHLTPVQWGDACGGTCLAAIDAGAAQNTILHITSGIGLTFNWGLTETFAWRYGIKIDSGGSMGNSDINVNWDGTGTILDTSSGGTYAIQGKMGGIMVCGALSPFYTAPPSTAAPCFNLGANGGLYISNFYAPVAAGSFIETAGASITAKDGSVDGIGTIQASTDHYLLNVTGINSPNGTQVIWKDITASGQSGSIHSHGINTGANKLGSLRVQNSEFTSFQDPLAAVIPNLTILTGNTSVNTNGSASVSLTDTGTVTSGNNKWDKPPAASIANCGTGCSVQGGFVGQINVGSTNPTTAADLTLPWIPDGFTNGSCVFSATSNVLVTGSSSGSPAPVTWHLTFASDLHSGQVYYNCQGGQ